MLTLDCFREYIFILICLILPIRSIAQEDTTFSSDDSQEILDYPTVCSWDSLNDLYASSNARQIPIKFHIVCYDDGTGAWPMDLDGGDPEEGIIRILEAGYYERTWDATNTPSGIYYLRLLVTDEYGKQLYLDTEKVVVMK